MMFNRDQAARLRMLAEEEGLGNEEPKAQPEQNFIIIVAVAFIAAFLIILGVAFFTQNNKNYEDTINSLTKQGRMLKEEIAILTAKTERLETSLAANSSKNSELLGQVGQLGALKEDLRDKLAALEQERAGLIKEMSFTRDKMRSLEESKEDLENRLQSDLGSLKERVGQLDAKVAEALATYEKSGPEKSNNVRLGNDGEVVLIDPKNQFVLVNLGRDKGIEKGMWLEVLKENAVVGQLQVIEARKEASACDVQMDLASLGVGDKVRIKK